MSNSNPNDSAEGNSNNSTNRDLAQISNIRDIVNNQPSALSGDYEENENRNQRQREPPADYGSFEAERTGYRAGRYTEYVHQLEARNKNLEAEVERVIDEKTRLEAILQSVHTQMNEFLDPATAEDDKT